ncbi:MAG: DUF1015 domain-containing protein [Chitinophagales bacterium]|nr:DUF1015 domain-containing protein [Chitinophagales bacterium]
MAIIKPFEAVRPKPEYAVEVSSLPYDVMNTQEARAMAEGNPKSFLHVSRAEIDFPEGVDEHSQAVYEKARDNFYGMIEQGILFQDAYPFLYIYEQTMDGRTQIGLVACSSVDDYFNDVIKKHEFTRPEKEEDRIRHMETLMAHVGPIFLTYPKNVSVDAIVDDVITKNEPVYNILSNDGVHHRCWVIRDRAQIEQLVEIFKTQIPYTYIADGHHRTASAAKVGKKMREQNPDHNGTEEYNFFLSVLFPDDQLQIMDYNRVVKDLNGLSNEELLQSIGLKFEIQDSEFETAKPAQLHEFAMYLNGGWYKLKAKPEIIKADPIGILDVTILQENVLQPLLGINDPRTDKRIDFIGGIRGLKELQRRVDNGEMKVAFALYPVSLKQLMDIADSGNVMPPKSTWFEPKLRDGLFSHLFE